MYVGRLMARNPIYFFYMIPEVGNRPFEVILPTSGVFCFFIKGKLLIISQL